MKARVVIAVVMVLSGILLAIITARSILGDASMLSWITPLVLGAFLFVAGLVLLVTELLESWLSRGQKALVDGLQAG